MNAVDSALMAVLEAIDNVETLAPGGVHNIARGQQGKWPAIVFNLSPSADDQPRFGGSDGIEKLSYDVKVIAPLDEQANVGALIESIHAALQGVPMTISGVDHLQTLRQRRIAPYPEQDGRTYIHRGATYEITISHPA